MKPSPLILSLVAASLSFRCLAAVPEPGQVAAALRPFIDRHELVGAVALLASNDRILRIEAVGVRDIATKAPMQPDTIFWIASQSKPITATALMMLVDEGRVNLDDPVEKYLPEFRDSRIQKVSGEPGREKVTLEKTSRPILVRHLLSHTSGLPFSTPIEVPTLDCYPLAVRVQSYALTHLNSEPGEKFSYSNAGINAIGRIIEVVSGKSFEQFLHERLFDPLGMKDTTFWPSVEQLSRLATCYRAISAEEGYFRENPTPQMKRPLDDRQTRFPFPAGGLFSTAKDTARFCQMILNEGALDGRRYVSAAAIREMGRDQTGPLLANYGLGWRVGDKPRRMGHGGADGTDMTVYPEKNLVTVWMVAGAQGASRGAFMKVVMPPDEPTESAP